ncbi:MAG: hypothetical protein ACXQTS_07015 [Candidatus Methanospirareceae archaeon]
MEEKKKILLSFTPAEAKRLIAKGVAELAEVKRALKKGIVIIAQGTTNAFVASEILKRLHIEKEVDISRFAAGIITDKACCVVPKGERQSEIIIKDGEISEDGIEKAIEELSSEDVFIKGANALDPHGVAGILVAHPTGGTIGSAIGTVMARGVNFIIPVGIEKTIPFSIVEAARRIGNMRFYKSMGLPAGLMPVFGKIVTEVEALKILGADDAFPIGAGGVDGGEGSVVICAEGSEEKMEEIMRVAMEIKGGGRVKVLREDCSKCKREVCVYASGI